MRKARQASLGVKGANIFNLLPKDIRNLNVKSSTADKVQDFKSKLDNFLSNIPDQPTLPGFGRAAETNSLLHQIPLSNSNNF